MVEGNAIEFASDAVAKSFACGRGIIVLVITGNVTAGGVGTNKMCGTCGGAPGTRHNLEGIGTRED